VDPSQIDLFFSNFNIHPLSEYIERRKWVRQYAETMKMTLIEPEAYGLRDYLCDVDYNSDVPKVRCLSCIYHRLETTAQYASMNGYRYFSTTLLVSTYQDHDGIKACGESLANKYGLEFIYHDSRPSFLDGQRIAKDLGIYLQEYCGCIFSEAEHGPAVQYKG
jgi:predicted adenine nucleotide alpha hydrolase (AANH) superfamily ATPase